MKDQLDIDPNFDLVLEREVDVPARFLWQAWTTSDHLKPWFCPKPWSVIDCEIDLRPGGVFSTTMGSPDGDAIESVGCYLEVILEERLTWTNMLLPGFRPAPENDLPFTGTILLHATDTGTIYKAVAQHRDESGRSRHEEMGFVEGWGTVLDQLVEYVKTSLS